MYKTNIVKAALYLRPPHPFPAPPCIPPLALYARYYVHLRYCCVSLYVHVYMCA